MEKLQIDYSTLNQDELRRLPLYKKPPTYEISKSMGSCCAGDPPGFPTYFIQHVYTRHGNSPRKGASELICGRMIETEEWGGSWEEHRTKKDALMMKLWNPLPIDHPRTRAWIIDTYNHARHCYLDPTKKQNDDDWIVIWPVPYWKLKSFKDDVQFCDEWRETKHRQTDLENKYVISKTRKIATPSNHMAVKRIQKFYPEYIPNLDLIENPPKSTGNWWETRSRRPTPEECPGKPRREPCRLHPMNGEWCQKCGWHE